jgi:hypothetical protein
MLFILGPVFVRKLRTVESVTTKLDCEARMKILEVMMVMTMSIMIVITTIVVVVIVGKVRVEVEAEAAATVVMEKLMQIKYNHKFIYRLHE